MNEIIKHIEQMYNIFESLGGQLMKFVEVVRKTFDEQQLILEKLNNKIDDKVNTLIKKSEGIFVHDDNYKEEYEALYNKIAELEEKISKVKETNNV